MITNDMSHKKLLMAIAAMMAISVLLQLDFKIERAREKSAIKAQQQADVEATQRFFGMKKK